jgi:5-methylthioadenosine/S-adenosylhomocysteine deaminase
MIVRGVTVLDFHGLGRRGPVDVFIEGNRVRRIAPATPRQALQGASSGEGRAEAAAAPADEIDGTGCWLIAGLVSAHSHTAMTLLRGAAEDCRVEDWFNAHIWRYERNLTPEDVYWGSLLGAAEMLLAGVTCVADHYFHMGHAYRAFQEIGIRADLAWAMFGVGEDWQSQRDQALEFAAAHRGRDPRLQVSLGPHSPYICPEAFLRKTAEMSTELGIKMHIHVSEERGQVERSLAETGRTPVQVLADAGVLRPGTILAHCYYATDADLALVKACGAGVAHCAKTYMKFGDVHDFLPRALEAGVRVGLGSDGAASNNTMNIFETARCAALLAKASRGDPLAGRIDQILPLCHEGGEVLGLPGYGRVEEGGLADFVLIDPRMPAMTPEHNLFANILYSLDERAVRTVIVDGRVLVRDGRLLNVDVELLARKASEITARLLSTTTTTPMQRY